MLAVCRPCVDLDACDDRTTGSSSGTPCMCIVTRLHSRIAVFQKPPTDDVDTIRQRRPPSESECASNNPQAEPRGPTCRSSVAGRSDGGAPGVRGRQRSARVGLGALVGSAPSGIYCARLRAE
ncbi:hypothetical protein C8T65DRAFT_639695 [Cerioporus squamosus]|nr:hypothetical protein C8T65DRAFT_639695 [Cerioporus squamosus]